MVAGENNSMKKACIATFCEWSSYGSIMQAIGLKRTLEKLNCESFIIKDNPRPSYKNKSFFPGSIKRMLKWALSIPYQKSNLEIYKKGMDFIDKNLDIKYFDNYTKLKQCSPTADIYIAGSDQIWHPALCKEIFFLDFVPENKKRISYAASMGITDIPTQNKEKFRKLVSRLDAYSVRENSMVNIIQDMTDSRPQVHIDPAFLIAAEEWRSLEVKYNICEPYILVYALYWDKSFNAELKELHKKTGYKIVSLQSAFRPIYSNQIVSNAGPGEFLWLVDHAQAVITSSFHGTVFSLIFNKRVSAIINPDSRTRISDLFDMLNIKTGVPSKLFDEFNINYSYVNEKIVELKEKSITYLRGEIYGEE